MLPIPRPLRALLAGAALALAAVPPALAQGWPTRPVNLVVNFPPGGPADILARSVAATLQAQFGQPFVVDNKAGAGGNLGAAVVAKAPADGHTWLVGIDSVVTVNPHLYPAMPFKPSELKPVLVMASSGLLFGVHPGTGIRSFGDLLRKGRERALNFSSAGNGSPGHLASALLAARTPVRTVHVPYKGNTPAVTAVVAGEVEAGILATPGMLPAVQAGKITPLAVTSTRRSPLAPELPTVAELGLKALEAEVLYLVMAPAATPEATVQAMARAIADALQRPDIRERMKSLDMVFDGQAGAAAARRLAELQARHGETVRSTDIKAQ